MPAARKQLNPPQPGLPPVSPDTSLMKSGVRASRMSAAFIMILRRALGPMADHLGKAAAAASHAALASATVAAAAIVATSPVTGSLRS
jgi:hypothetical protein